MTGVQIRLDGSEERAPAEGLDQWFTPPWLAERMVDEAARWCFSPRRILEPSSGSGAILGPLSRRFPFAHVDHYEIDPALAASTGARCTDFLRVNTETYIDDALWAHWSLCVTNPPYSDGRDGAFLAKAAAHSEVVVALVRTHALHGVERHAAVWSRRGVRRINLLIRRPRFAGAADGSPEHEFCVLVIGPETIPQGIEWW